MFFKRKQWRQGPRLVWVTLSMFVLLFAWQMRADAQSGDTEEVGQEAVGEELVDEAPDDVTDEIVGIDRPDTTDDDVVLAEEAEGFAPCLTVNLCFLDPVKVTNFESQMALDVGFINADSNLDFVASSTFRDGIRIKNGCGNGTFCSTYTWTMGDGPTDVALADFNGDGFTDVIATNPNQDRVRIRWGHSGLSTYSHYTAGDGPRVVKTADLNIDGLDDFATLDHLGSTVTVRLRNAGGGFSKFTYSAGNEPRAVAFGDCNGDGDLDMLYTARDGDDDRVYVRRNNNGALGQFLGPTLAVEVPNALGAPFSEITTADYNEDGILDIIVSLTNSYRLAIALGTGNCFFGNPIVADVSESPYQLYTADFNQDGHLDFVVAHLSNDAMDQKIGIYLGNGTGNFVGPYVPDTVDDGWVLDLGVGDFNGDGSPDIVFTQSDGVYILESY